eukprot:8110208-Lingulodinium_polyedra.AAC.1
MTCVLARVGPPRAPVFRHLAHGLEYAQYQMRNAEYTLANHEPQTHHAAEFGNAVVGVACTVRQQSLV